jgi:hypothetical protein
MFDSAIMSAIFSNRVIDIRDQALVPFIHRFPAPFLGKILLKMSYSLSSYQGNALETLSVIADVNRALDDLMRTADLEREWRHHRIAEAVAQYWISVRRRSPIMTEALREQNLLSGAIVVGNVELVLSLLGDGDGHETLANVHAESPYFGTPIQLAITWGYFEIVQYLLACSAIPDGALMESTIRRYRLSDYALPKDYLALAVLQGHDDVVSLLLEPELRHFISMTDYGRAVVAAARKGRSDLMDLLLRTAGKEISDFDGLGNEILWDATFHNQIDIVRMLLDHDLAKVDEKAYLHERERPSTALCIAASKGNIPMTQLLLDYGADLFLYCIHQPLECAAHYGHDEMVDFLVEHGAGVSAALITPRITES